MSRSRKKHPGSTAAVCKSQKNGKIMASKRFRRLVKTLLSQGNEGLPVKSIELTSSYDLGGDGKVYWVDHTEKFMRK